MKKEYIISLNLIEDLNDFIRGLTYNVESDVDAIRGRLILDAKSFLGLMSLDLSVPITVRINTDDELDIERFGAICKLYEVK